MDAEGAFYFSNVFFNLFQFSDIKNKKNKKKI